MSLEQALADNTVAVLANTEVLKQLLAGREEALEKLTGAADKAPTTRKRATKAADPVVAAGNGTAETATDPAASAAPTTSAPVVVSDDDLRAAASAYVGGAGEDKADRQARGLNLKAITDHFGTKTLVGPEGVQDADQKAQTLFYIKRFDAGLPVDFSAEYDFAGDPAQGDEPAAAEGGDDFDIG